MGSKISQSFGFGDHQPAAVVRTRDALHGQAYRPEQLKLNTGGPRDPSLLMTLDELKNELAPLTVEVERQIHEGSFHSGASATVQVVAVRVAR